MMLRKEMDPSFYEGLVFATAARYAPILDDDVEDVQQILRVKVWKSLGAYDPARSRKGVQSWVYSCVKNQVKTLLRLQNERNERRGGQEYIEEVSEELRPSFELRYLVTESEQVYAEIEDEQVELPSTLTSAERSVVLLLLLELSQTEVAATLDMTRHEVYRLHKKVQVKMSDWRPGVGEPSVVPVAA